MPNRERLVGPWLVFAAAGVILAVFTYLYAAVIEHGREHRTYGAFLLSGEAANHHQDPFAIHPGVWPIMQLDDGKTVVYDVNLQPPVMLPLFQLFAKLDLQTGIRLWMYGSMVLFLGGTAALMFVFGKQVGWLLIALLLVSEPTLSVLAVGEDFALMFALSAAAVCAFKTGRECTAAICVGVLTAVHPNFGLWFLFLFLAGYRRAAATAAAVAVLLTAVPVLIYGPAIYLQFAHALSMDNHSLVPADISLVGLFTRAGHRHLGLLISALALVGCCSLLYRRRADALTLGGLACCAGILFAPLGWYSYLVVLFPCLAALKMNRIATFAALLMFFGYHLGLFVGIHFQGPWANGHFALAAFLFFVCFVAQVNAPDTTNRMLALPCEHRTA